MAKIDQSHCWQVSESNRHSVLVGRSVLIDYERTSGHTKEDIGQD